MLRWIVAWMRGRRRAPAIALTAIGNADPICPYCSAPLPKMPARKSQCKSCGNTFSVRTRPLDNRKIIVRADQLDIVAEQWASVNGTLEAFRGEQSEREAMRAELRTKFGGEPSENDVQWGLLVQQGSDNAANRLFGLYRNTRMDMALLLTKENRDRDALSHFLAAAYLDLNGPTNSGTGGPAFSPDPPELCLVAPGLVSRIVELILRTNMAETAVGEMFFVEANRLVTMPDIWLGPGDAWMRLRRAIIAAHPKIKTPQR